MDDIVKSNVTGIEYNASDVVRIVNYQQAIYYINNHVKLLDVYPSIDNKSKRPIFVYIFNRFESKDAYDTWCKQGAKEVYQY